MMNTKSISDMELCEGGLEVFGAERMSDGKAILRKAGRAFGASVVLDKIRLDANGSHMNQMTAYLRRTDMSSDDTVKWFGLELGTTEVAFVKAWHTKEYGPCIQPCGPVEATYVVVSASTRNRSAWFTVPGQNKDTARAMGFWRMYHEKLTRNYGADHYILPIGYTYLAEGTLPKGVRVVSRSREMRQLGISGVAYIDQKKADELRGKYQAIFDAEDEEICARVERRSRSEAARAEVIAIAQPYFERLDKAGSKDRYSAGTDELVLVGTENLAYHDPDFEQKLRAFTDAQEKQYTAHQKAVKEWRSFRDEWREKFKPFTDRLDEKGYSYTYDDSWSNWLRDRERGMKLMMDGVSYPYADYGIRKLRGDM